MGEESAPELRAVGWSPLCTCTGSQWTFSCSLDCLEFCLSRVCFPSSFNFIFLQFSSEAEVYCHLLLPVSTAISYCQCLLPSLTAWSAASVYCHLLLPVSTAISYCSVCYQCLLPSLTASVYCHFLLQVSTAISYCQCLVLSASFFSSSLQTQSDVCDVD